MSDRPAYWDDLPERFRNLNAKDRSLAVLGSLGGLTPWIIAGAEAQKRGESFWGGSERYNRERRALQQLWHDLYESAPPSVQVGSFIGGPAGVASAGMAAGGAKGAALAGGAVGGVTGYFAPVEPSGADVDARMPVAAAGATLGAMAGPVVAAISQPRTTARKLASFIKSTAKESRNRTNIFVSAADHPRADLAREMRAAGKSDDEIYQETGLFIGLDGIPRREIPLDPQDFKPGAFDAGDRGFGDVLNKPALTEAVPELSGESFRFVEFKPHEAPRTLGGGVTLLPTNPQRFTPEGMVIAQLQKVIAAKQGLTGSAGYKRELETTRRLRDYLEGQPQTEPVQAYKAHIDDSIKRAEKELLSRSQQMVDRRAAEGMPGGQLMTLGSRDAEHRLGRILHNSTAVKNESITAVKRDMEPAFRAEAIPPAQLKPDSLVQVPYSVLSSPTPDPVKMSEFIETWFKMRK